MGKVKRKGLSESASKKGNAPTKKLNPFEMHVNRQKHNVVGRKLKSDKGLPGISRSKAMKKRKATLLQEYKVQNKANKFFDRRIGERNRAMTQEDRVVARFAAERMKMFNKKQIYNLADDEVLTHRGQTLSEIEKFDDPRSDDEEEDESGKLGANFVEDAHFGGGMLKKTEEGDKKSRKDLIEELIAESKKRKAEKQRAREQTIELTEKLDTEWQDLLPIMASSKKKPTDIMEVEKPDSYDTMMRELKFEARAQASDPLKTETEVKEEEAKRRAELEAEREQRMHSDSGGKDQKLKHRSADDLDDGFAIEEEPEVGVSYDSEGNIQLNGQAMDVSNDVQDEGENLENQSQNSEGDGEDEGSDDESNSDGDDEDDGETDDSLSDLKPPTESEAESETTEDEESPKEASELKEKFKRDETNEIYVNEDKKVLNTSVKDSDTTSQCVGALSESEKNTLLREVRKKFPNFTTIPEKYETFERILKNYSAKKQAVIISEMISKNHISVNAGSRTRLETLFAFLLQHLHNSSSKGPLNGFKLLSHLAPILYELTHLCPENSSQCILEVLKEKQQEFQQHQHKYPELSTLIFLKVVSLLFPTSDFRHRVVTPSIVFMCQMLFQCRIKSKRDVAAGFFLVTLLLEFTVLSKRFSPSAINFLCGILHLAIPKKNSTNVLAVPPFRKIGQYSDLLMLEERVEKEEDSYKMKLSDLSDENDIDTGFKLRALVTALSMLNECLSNLGNLSACPSIFHCADTLLTRIPVKNYPQNVRIEIEKLSSSFQSLKEKKLQFLVVERKRPKALRLYEPSIEKIFDTKRRRPMGKEKMEREKLLHKVKREQKAALREIRRDNAFLSKLKWKETVQSDVERVKKVKEIFGGAATQLGEIRALERKKKHMK